MANKIVGDLISRKALLSVLPRFSKDQVGYPLNGGISYAKTQINAAPSVDAMEVVHGRWIDRPSMKGQVYCSECATIEKSTDSNYKSMHCPNCGAKMDGDNHEDP